MTNSNYHFFPGGPTRPLKLWIKGVPVEDDAIIQLRRVAQLPFIHKHVAGMPDMHVGKGATIGSVIATKGAIIPAAVGVDIGCGMMAIRTSLTASDLPDNLSRLRTGIEAAIPHGRTANGDAKRDKGAWHNPPPPVTSRWSGLVERYNEILLKHPKAHSVNAPHHLGTLGTGNHFVEICLDEAQRVWVMLHSGSRGAGASLGNYFINKAKEEMERYFIGQYLPDQNLSYLVEHTELFDDYCEAVLWGQDFAAENRKAMMAAALQVLHDHLPSFTCSEHAVNCHHNYISREHHYGENVWVTRKGAVRAREGDLGIIPGSMGAKSFIVRGKGNPESFCSCSHGAGRKMSRTAALKTISLADHVAATSDVECRKDADVIDESPAAYKDIDAVMAPQSDLVEVVHTLKQVLCVKG